VFEKHENLRPKTPSESQKQVKIRQKITPGKSNHNNGRRTKTLNHFVSGTQSTRQVEPREKRFALMDK